MGYCSYSVDVGRYHESLSAAWPSHEPTPLADLPTTDGEWRCPRAATDGERCPLHDETASDEAVRETMDRALSGATDADDLRPSVEDPAVAAKRLVGLTAGTVDLSDRRVLTDDTAPLDLRCGQIGDLRLDGARLEVPLWLDGAAVDGLHAPETSTTAPVRCRYAELGRATFSGAAVEGRLSLRYSTVDGPVAVDGVETEGRIDLGFTTVEAEIDARRAACTGRFTTKEATAGSVSARHLAVSGTDPESSVPGLQVRGLETGGDVDLRDCECGGQLIGYAVEIGGDLRLSAGTVEDGISLGGGGTNLREARIEGRLDCAEATVGDDLKMSGRPDHDTNPEVGEIVDLSAAELESVDLAPALEAEAVSVVDLRGATVEAGRLGQPTDADPVVYDLQRASIGDVEIEREDGSAADIVRFDRTVFDGFRFGESREDFADRGWKVHAVPEPVRRQIAVGRQYGEAVELAADLTVVCAEQPRAREWLRDTAPPYDPAALAATVLEELDDEQRERVARNGPETADLLGERIFERERYREGFVTALARELDGQDTELSVLLSDDGAPPPVADLAGAVAAADDPEHSEDVVAARERVARAFAETLADDAPVELRPEHAEMTYIMARKGADDVGDTVAAGELFVNELRFRRRRHRRRAATATDRRTRWTARGRYVANQVFDVMAVYGEHPRRVFAVSVGTVLAGTAVFWALGVALPALDGSTYDGADGALLLSLESFSSLVLGGGSGVESHLVRLLASVEGFLGAFLVALFVFSLTRSLKR